ncbi:MAG: exodeoxyribonuclease VII small subunit [Saprospiraceae bacterium]|nr:exodeoxyribonuclease VII small subunit [Saprospiraceae bacterium]
MKEIVTKLQDDDINIEKLSEYIKRAQELRTYCADRLREIEETIQTNINLNNCSYDQIIRNCHRRTQKA